MNDYFGDWVINGIFTALQEYDVPWKDLDLDVALNTLYHGAHSGDKYASRLVAAIASEPITDDEVSQLCAALLAVNGVTWGKTWATLSAEYDPIENYSMTETLTNDVTTDDYGKTHTRTDNLSHTKTGTEQETPNITEITTPQLNVDVERDTYGFNSDSSVPANHESTDTTGTNTIQRTGTATMTYNTTDGDSGTVQDSDTGRDTHTRNYTLSRHGNIGVTTSQQMLQSERDLWVWNYFYDVVFPGLDRVLTLRIY